MIGSSGISYPLIDDKDFEELKINEAIQAPRNNYRVEEDKEDPVIVQVESVGAEAPGSNDSSSVGNPSPVEQKRAGDLLSDFLQATLKVGETGKIDVIQTLV